MRSAISVFLTGMAITVIFVAVVTIGALVFLEQDDGVGEAIREGGPLMAFLIGVSVSVGATVMRLVIPRRGH